MPIIKIVLGESGRASGIIYIFPNKKKKIGEKKNYKFNNYYSHIVKGPK